jgi:hypothetical protein
LAESLPETAAQKEYQICCFFLVVFIWLDTNALMKQPTPLKTASKGLAGALAIASGSSAYGAIVSANLPTNIFPASFPTGSTTTVSWDVNGDGINDFNFSFRQPESTTGVDWQANIYAFANSAVLGYVGPYFPYAGRFTNGQAIAAGGGNTFQPGVAAGTQIIIASIYAGTTYGQFQPPNSTGFIGFQFTVGANTFNGYIQLKTSRSFGIDFISAFYNDTPGGAITAGQVPEPGTLALLAFGAVGVAGAIAKRRKALAS